MSDTRFTDLEIALEFLRTIEDADDYIPLVKLNDPILSLAMVELFGCRRFLETVPSEWKNHEGKLISGSLVREAIETGTSNMSYTELMEFFLQRNARNSIRAFAGPLLLKRMANDPSFVESLQNDTTLAPLLFQNNPEAKAMLPDFTKNHTKDSEALRRADMIANLGFSPNNIGHFEEDILAIQNLLTNKELMLRQLDSLEDDLNETIKALNPSVQLPLPPLLQSDHRLFNKPYPKDPNKSFLFEFFKDWALKNGFRGLTRLEKDLTHQQFMQNLVDALPFKDDEFDGQFHGAWTHLIQWYCVVSALKKGELHLHFSPAELFSEIGKRGGETNRVWDRTFETAQTKIKLLTDFRDVTGFHDFLLKDTSFAHRCPTVQSLLYSRALKVDEKKSNPKTPG